MAITVGKLYSNSMSLYNMKLVAGHMGLDRIVEWVHDIEDVEAAAFLRGYELVFTVGYMNQSDDWLINFITELYKANASAVIVNIGPYIKEIGDDVIKYCDKMSLPLFTIPWKVRIVDVTRDFCERIFHGSQIEENVATSMKNIIYKIGNPEDDIQVLERFGYPRDDYYCFASVSLVHAVERARSQNIEIFKKKAEQLAKVRHIKTIMFRYDNHVIIAMMERDKEEVRSYMDKLVSHSKYYKDKFEIRIGVSDIVAGLGRQSTNFEHASDAVLMAERQNKELLYYSDLDVYKLLLDVKDKSVLYKYYKEVLGDLEEYDKKNNNDLCGFLQVYLDNNASTQLIAQQEYVHRNTVNNQIKKIEKITGLNLSNLEDKFRCSMAFAIKEIL